MDNVTLIIVEFSIPIITLIIMHAFVNDFYKDWRMKRKWKKMK
jgi:hypothetical protein